MIARKETFILKLLYIWIEEFRNIRQQGFAVDEEYKISIGVPDGAMSLS